MTASCQFLTAVPISAMTASGRNLSMGAGWTTIIECDYRNIKIVDLTHKAGRHQRQQSLENSAQALGHHDHSGVD
jgi:hypothetical protein